MTSPTMFFTKWGNGLGNNTYILFFDTIDEDNDYFESGCFGEVSSLDIAKSTGYIIRKSSIVKNGSKMHRRIHEAELVYE
jgi:hypothetical protein